MSVYKQVIMCLLFAATNKGLIDQVSVCFIEHCVQVVEANFKRMEQAHNQMHMQCQEMRHTNEMLVVDKAYLSKQVSSL